MESVHHRAEVIHVIDSHSPASCAIKHEDTPADMSESSLDARFDISLNEKLEFSKTLTPTHQSKKELYIKLDEILITSLHEAFEVYPGSTVDRVEMVEFLSSVVKNSLSVYPDLEKILCLRDTVLTARVKRAFPEVEYKRKQIRQDHFRKAWLYVNIRRKPGMKDDEDIDAEKGNVTVRLEARRHNSSNKTSVSTSGTWTPEAPRRQPSPESVLIKKKQTPLNTQLPSTIDHLPEPLRKSTEETKTKHPRDPNSNGNTEYKMLAPLPSSEPVSMVTGYNIRENSAVVLDNYTIIKWVKMNYTEDSTSYVPVQDVVKAFKNSYGIDITYKECHQMIYSAFTSPRQRTCPLKTVRVSSMGAQYVYRGIAPVRTDRNETGEEENYVEDSPPEPIVHSDFIHEEREEVWRKLVEELKQERDQLILDRNQALSALMDIEKEHARALSVIEQQRKELDSITVDKNLTNKSVTWTSGERSDLSRLTHSHYGRFSETSASKAESNMLSALAPTCEHCSAGKQTYEHLKEERDQIWKDIVQEASRDKEEAKTRLEVVKSERDIYLERLHSLEKENQRLRDSVAVPYSTPPSLNTVKHELSSMQAIKLENRAQALRNSIKNTDCRDVKNARDSLNSVLSHLRSKRKQSTPTKFSKVPRLSNSENDTHSEPCGTFKENATSPAFMDSGSSSLEDGEFCFDKFRRAHNNQATTASQDTDTDIMNGSPTSVVDPNEMLLYFEGSDMVAFKPHPMEC